MYLYKGKKDKYWYAVFSVPNDDLNAKRPFKTIWKNTGTINKREAEIISDAWKVEKNKGTLPLTNKKITFKLFVDNEYLNWSKAEKSHGAFISNIYSCKALVPFFGMYKLSDITPYLIDKYKAERKNHVSERTVNIEIACLKQIFSKAEEWNFIMTNPAAKVKKFTEPKRIPRFISLDEENLLMQNSSKWLQMFIIIGLGTGMRSGEILNIQFDNIDLFRKLIFVKSDKEGGFMTKTRMDRVIPITNDLSAELCWFMNNWIDYRSMDIKERKPEQQTYLFCDENGGKILSVKKSFARSVKKSGLKDVSPHTLRHTYASRFVMAGGDIRTLALILGHTSIKTTEIYAHVSPEHVQASVNKYVVMNSYRRFVGKGDESEIALNDERKFLPLLQ